jgi:CheY-like chemotaxis protein
MPGTVSAAAGITEVVPRTILVVDDRPDDVKLLTLMLDQARVRNPVQSVETVFKAISYLNGDGIYADRDCYPVPALLLVDLHLTDGSGLDILRWIQAHPALAPAAVVVLTGSDIGQIKQSYALGADSFLVKPLKFADFENLIAHVRGIKATSTSEGYVMEVQ